MKLDKLDTDKMRFEPLLMFNVKLPVSMVAAIDSRSKNEMLTRSAWARRELYRALSKPEKGGRQ